MKKALGELLHFSNDETESDKREQIISALSEDILKLSTEEMFYNLPVQVMKEIIEASKDSDENNEDYIAGIKNIFSRMSEIRPNDANLLFNSEFRVLSLDDSMQLLEGMKFNQFLTNILQMHKEDKSEVDVDWEFEIGKLKEEVQRLNEKAKKLEDENKELKTKNVDEMKEDDFANEDRISLTGDYRDESREMDKKFFKIIGNDSKDVIKTSSSYINIVGNRQNVTIIGDKNKIKMTGNWQTLNVIGNENVLKKILGNDQTIEINGNDNKLKKIHGTRMKVTITGVNNAVLKNVGHCQVIFRQPED